MGPFRFTNLPLSQYLMEKIIKICNIVSQVLYPFVSYCMEHYNFRAIAAKSLIAVIIVPSGGIQGSVARCKTAHTVNVSK